MYATDFLFFVQVYVGLKEGSKSPQQRPLSHNQSHRTVGTWWMVLYNPKNYTEHFFSCLLQFSAESPKKKKKKIHRPTEFSRLSLPASSS